MAQKFPVPQFITIEDRLMGLITFKQLFALLGAFLLTFFVFKISPYLGLIIGVLSFGLAFLLTFVYINGKPFLYNLPYVFDYFLRGRKFIWQRVEKAAYKEISLPEEIETEITTPEIKPRKKLLKNLVLEIDYKEVVPQVKERVTLSFNEPILSQAENLNKIFHHHIANPRNPYRLFPYIKFYRSFKK